MNTSETANEAKNHAAKDVLAEQRTEESNDGKADDTWHWVDAVLVTVPVRVRDAEGKPVIDPATKEETFTNDAGWETLARNAGGEYIVWKYNDATGEYRWKTIDERHLKADNPSESLPTKRIEREQRTVSGKVNETVASATNAAASGPRLPEDQEFADMIERFAVDVINAMDARFRASFYWDAGSQLPALNEELQKKFDIFERVIGVRKGVNPSKDTEARAALLLSKFPAAVLEQIYEWRPKAKESYDLQEGIMSDTEFYQWVNKAADSVIEEMDRVIGKENFIAEKASQWGRAFDAAMDTVKTKFNQEVKTRVRTRKIDAQKREDFMRRCGYGFSGLVVGMVYNKRPEADHHELARRQRKNAA